MNFGYGKHMWDVSQAQFAEYVSLIPVLAALYFATPVFIKLALLTLYHRINPGRCFRWTIYALGAAIVIPNIIFACLTLWDRNCNPKTSDGSCLIAITIAQAVLNIVSDIILLIMPLPTVLLLVMPIWQKVALYTIFVLASAAKYQHGRLSNATLASCVIVSSFSDSSYAVVCHGKDDNVTGPLDGKKSESGLAALVELSSHRGSVVGEYVGYTARLPGCPTLRGYASRMNFGWTSTM
ncbi:hypothetical protein BGZ63DRAFT_465148 [Mariannaea sp. PMI_226]|nr:hypothetical protein BGZ63DRAFT_465148 [Mariannaea sp. PMI_226]